MSEFQPHLTVASVIEKNGRFLLVKEYDAGKLVYNQPAGHVEANETILQACVRETLEETGYVCTPIALIGIYQFKAANGATYFRFCFHCECTEEPINDTLDHDIVEAVWLDMPSIQNLQTQLRSELVLACLQDYLSGQRTHLDILKAPLFAATSA